MRSCNQHCNWTEGGRWPCNEAHAAFKPSSSTEPSCSAGNRPDAIFKGLHDSGSEIDNATPNQTSVLESAFLGP